MKAVTLGKVEDEQVLWHSLDVKTIPIPQLKDKSKQVLVKVKAAALNHRDVFIRQELYPNWKLGSILGADGVGTIVDGPDDLKGKRVIFHPMRGWESDLRGPTTFFGIRGGAEPMAQDGTLVEYIACPKEEVELAPDHLSDHEAASLPLAGLTAFRALFTKCNPPKGSNLLVTGIGGGVALFVLQFAVAAGMNVWVTSSKSEKLEMAKKLGARGGVNYKEPDWNRKLKGMLPKESPWLDFVVDSGGGDILAKSTSLLRTGGIVSCYGMTTGRSVSMSMMAVLKNIELKGSTMGSAKEFKEMVHFVSQHKIKPVISKVFPLDQAEGAFQLMKNGDQFGKIVLVVENSPSSKL